MPERPPEDAPQKTPEPVAPPEPPPLVRGRPLTREESVERMYRRFNKTFEELAK